MSGEVEEHRVGHSDWAVSPSGRARRDIVVSGVPVTFELDAVREASVLSLDEAITLSPTGAPDSELSDWREGVRIVEPLGLMASVPLDTGDDGLVDLDAVIGLAEALLAQRVRTALDTYRKRRGGWEAARLARKVGQVPKPYRLSHIGLAEAIVRRATAEEVIRECGQ